MKKIVALLLSLMLLLGTANAFASGIIFSAGKPAATEAPAASGETGSFTGVVEYKTFHMDDGLSFIVPEGWQMEELPEDFAEEGGFLYYTDAESGLRLQAWVDYLGDGRTSKEHSEVILADTENYKNCMLATNEMGAEVIAFVSADLTAAGGCILSPDGFAVYFSVSRMDGATLHGDELAQNLAAEICGYLHFTDAASATAQASQTATFNGNFTMPIPDGWTEEPLRETDLHRMTAPDGDLYFYLRVNSYENVLSADTIYRSFSDSEHFTGCELLTGKTGLIVRADSTDLSFSTLMIPDDNGNVYILTFGSHDGNQVTDNAQLAQIRDMMVNGIVVD